MLKKANKLNNISVKDVFLKGKRVHSALFLALFVKEKENKFAVTVSKKKYKLAVDRNRAKRRVFAILPNISPTETGFYVINIKEDINKISFLDLKNDLINLLCKK